MGLPGGSVVKNPPGNAGDKETWAQSLGQEDPLEEYCTPVLLLRKSHGQRSLAGSSPWGHRESDTTEHSADFGDCLPPALHTSSVSHAAPLSPQITISATAREILPQHTSNYVPPLFEITFGFLSPTGSCSKP